MNRLNNQSSCSTTRRSGSVGTDPPVPARCSGLGTPLRRLRAVAIPSSPALRRPLFGPSVSGPPSPRPDFSGPAHVTHRVHRRHRGGGPAGLSAAWSWRGAESRTSSSSSWRTTLGGTSTGRTPSARSLGGSLRPCPLRREPFIDQLLREMGVVEGSTTTGTPSCAEDVCAVRRRSVSSCRTKWREGLYPRSVRPRKTCGN